MAISTQVEVLRSPDLFSHATVTKVAHGIVGLVQHLRGRFTEQLSARDTELEAVRRDADGVRGELASVTEARDQLLHEVESLTASATAGATEAAQLRAALQKEQAARGVAEEDRDSARALVAKLQGNAEQWAKDHRAVDHLASNLRAELESTKASLAKSQQALQALTDQHHALQAEVHTMLAGRVVVQLPLTVCVYVCRCAGTGNFCQADYNVRKGRGLRSRRCCGNNTRVTS